MKKLILIGLAIVVFALLVSEETHFVRQWVMNQEWSNGVKALLLITNIGFIFSVAGWSGRKTADLIFGGKDEK